MSVARPSSQPSLYVHVPFCAKKCEYCAFYSQPPSGDSINRFVEALVCEMERAAAGIVPRTVFFGGGTPSLLNLRQWERILSSMARLGLLGAKEWTVECNPATISLDKARLLRSHGVNRISMGVQSFDGDLLDRLGRIHTRSMIFKSYEILRLAGFENVNIDLMFAIPGQTMAHWRKTLTEALTLRSEHLSSYEVIYEEDTPLFAQLQAGRFSVDENLACAMYDELVSTAGASGFRQYEVANFARHRSGIDSELPDHACRHNVNYWRGGEYLGLGPSAAGFLNGVRTKNWSSTTLYCERIATGKTAVESRETLSPLARAGEIAAFGLRMNAGWPFDEFRRVSGFDLRESWPAEIEELIGTGYATMDSTRFQLTSKGLRFADFAAEQFLTLENGIEVDREPGALAGLGH